MSEPTPRVGVLGLGAMGMPMALRLLDAGFPVTAHDVVEARLASFRNAGAADSDCGRHAVLGGDVLCVVTPDERALWELVGDRGSAVADSSLRTVVLHSTVLPQAAGEVAATLGERGITVVEAPVSGGPARARAGELTILVGHDDDLGLAAPVLAALGKQIIHLGQVGSASAVKLANQLVLYASVAGLHEGLRLAAEFGVDEGRALEALAAATGDTWAGRHWGFLDELATAYDRDGTPPDQRPWRKDLREFIDAADARSIDASLAAHLAGSVGEQVEHHARSRAAVLGGEA